MTKIQPEAVEDIVNLSKSSPQAEDIVANSLVSRGRTLSFISFKVGVSHDLKSKAMDPFTWPPEYNSGNLLAIIKAFDIFGSQFITPIREHRV